MRANETLVPAQRQQGWEFQSASSETSPLRVISLGAWYLRNGSCFEVFRKLSFDVQPGRVLGVFGPNGCGKSTLLRSLAGLHTVREGIVKLPLVSSEPPQPLVTYIPQDYRQSFFPWASLQTNLLLTSPQPIRMLKRNREVLSKTLADLGLDLQLSLLPSQCSGGMLQQASLVRALSHAPAVLLADEPFSALDVEVASRVRSGFVRLVRKLQIRAVIALHDLQDILEVCDDVLVIPSRPFTSEPGRKGFALVELLANNARADRAERTEPTCLTDRSSFSRIMRSFLAEEPRP